MPKPKILIFVITDFSRLDGGVLWASNLLECMARVPNMDFTIVTSGTEAVRRPNEEFTKALGLRHSFVPFHQVVPPESGRGSEPHGMIGRALDIMLDKYYFIFERDARRQRHVDFEVMDIVNRIKPDLIVVNGRNAALHVPSIFSLSVPRCFITLDNEIDFHRLYRAQAGPLGVTSKEALERWMCRHGNWLANWRFRRFIYSIYNRCDGIIALTRGDLPLQLRNGTRRAVIPPILKRSDRRWSCGQERRLLFVGNVHVLKVMHVPNRLAIEWLCTRLSPELLKRDSGSRIDIIGATAEDVPVGWRHKNIDFLGRADKETVRHRMTTDSMFIAPISNNHGAKLKLAECLSHGMPFLATDAAMSGLPFLSCIPIIDLKQPEAAAQLAVEYMNNESKLTKLSESIHEQAEEARVAQDVTWRNFLMEATAGVGKL